MKAYLVVILAAVATPSLLVFLNAGSSTIQSVISLCAGAGAFSLMAVNLFLSTRPRGIEPAVGGLDRLYRLHKWTGITILPLVLFHKFVGMDLDGKIIASGLAKTSVDIAKFTFWVLAALLLISWLKRLPKRHKDLIPYQIWRVSHRLLGVLFLALILHQLFVKVPFNANAMISHYLNTMAMLGALSFAYTQVLAPFRSRLFTITSVTKHPAATIVEATPKKRGFSALKPGAFALISVKRKGLREPHPFTISQINSNGNLQFSIRPLGDFTRRIREKIAVGDTMCINAGYGRFDYRKSKRNQVWIAGGIGITPFLAFLETLPDTGTQKIQLVYCVRTRDEIVGLSRLKAAQNRVSSFYFHVHTSATDGRMNAELLENIVPFEIASASMWFCGPVLMRTSLLKGLRTKKQSPKSIHYEEFEFR